MSALPARHRRALRLFPGHLHLCLAIVLCGCATARPELAQVRALAAGTGAVTAFSELSERHVDTYQRARPYLSPAEDARERLLDAQRRAAQADVARLAQAVRLYLQALGRLADADAYEVQPELAGAGAAIRAWPGSGIDDRHVSAYTLLLQQLSRLGGAASQQAHLGQVLHDGDAPLQALLAVLAKNMQQSKTEEFRLFGLRHTLTRRQLAALAREHARLAAALTTTEARWTDR
ncbi:hypothetical protein GCN78_27495 [Janthinobacterium rivuli]|uniref:hypothetical protein n=1 Tax=Janthinobacterium sp. FT68W TaxID=2654255 RepID=UPI0012650E95|nr:hypothetical protein [Janthinobacterium sp. FT68W]KAB8045561.1 hypothetical protein GCN78_27495 [Janthinobacterium sp. FT68W]